MTNENKVCKQDGCEKVAYTCGMCNKHYVAERFAGITCTVEGCESPAARRGNLCIGHYSEWLYSPEGRASKRKHTPAKTVHYRSAHVRVVAERGRADTHECVDCGGQASDWSLKPDAKDVIRGAELYKAGSLYSLDPHDYEARCRNCHMAHDSKHGLTRAGNYGEFETNFRPETRAKAEEAVAMIKSGQRIVDVAKHMGCSPSTVSTWFLGIEQISIREWQRRQKAGEAK